MALTNDRSTNVSKASARYTQGGVSDIYNNRVGWWERINLERHDTDIFFDIDAKTEKRPDLIAYKVYKLAKYAWIVLQFNNIVDINEELVAGKTIILPTPERLNSAVLTNATGGNRVS